MAWVGTEFVLSEWSQCIPTKSGLLQESCESMNSHSAPGLSTAALILQIYPCVELHALCKLPVNS